MIAWCVSNHTKAVPILLTGIWLRQPNIWPNLKHGTQPVAIGVVQSLLVRTGWQDEVKAGYLHQTLGLSSRTSKPCKKITELMSFPLPNLASSATRARICQLSTLKIQLIHPTLLRKQLLTKEHYLCN